MLTMVPWSLMTHAVWLPTHPDAHQIITINQVGDTFNMITS